MLSPFGLSDHVTVKILPLKRSATSTPKTRVKVRDMRQSNCLAMRTYLEAIDIQTLVDSKSTYVKVKFLFWKIL